MTGAKAGRQTPPRRGPARSGKPYKPPVADPARDVAYRLLRAVAQRDAYANLVMPSLLAEAKLSGRDAAFATELGYGALRAQGTLDAVIARCSARPLAEIDPPLLDVLRLGAYQLLRTRVPAHAAVSATVDLARSVLSHGPASFANAVLRRVAERDADAWVELLSADGDELDRLVLAYAHPRWVASVFRDALGGDLAETAAALAADDTRPQVHLVARPGLISRADLIAQAGEGAEAGPWSPWAVRLTEGGDPGSVPGVASGLAAVQDEGSQLVASALAAVPIVGRDERWLDVCAGPGGKAALLAALGAERGARLLAAEVAPHRARLVAGALGALPADVVVSDSTRPPWRDGSFDRVMVDAPCTGLGALRRRPEARWRRRPDDLAELTALQRALLTCALAAVRPGGVVAYVVCSPHLAETVLGVRDVLRRTPGVEQIDAREFLPGVPHLGDGPAVQLWPHRQGTDAMFLALLRKS